MNYLFIINQPAYGNELAYNGLRLAMALQKEHGANINMFFLGDGVSCAMKNQKTPDGYYNLERMMKVIIRKQGSIHLCGSCLDARGILEEFLIEGTIKSTMSNLALLTEKADKVLTF